MNLKQKIIHIGMAITSLLGILGYSLVLLTYASFLGAHEAITKLLFYLVSIGGFIVNLAGAGIENSNAMAGLFGVYFGFMMIPLVLLFWGTFLLGGWFYEFPNDNKPAIKTVKGWFLGIIYYPMIAFGLITVFFLIIKVLANE